MWASSGLGSGRAPRDRPSNTGSRPSSAVNRLNLELNFESGGVSGRSTPIPPVPSLSPLRDEFYGSRAGPSGASSHTVGGPPTPDERGVTVAPHPTDPAVIMAWRSKETRDANPDRLDLDRRELDQCPELVDEHRLRLLNYQHNAIARISRLELTRNLVFLDLYANAVEKIAGLECVPQLRVLMLGRNRIKSIGAGLVKLQRLDVLDLHNNDIASTSGLNSLANLRILNLAGNKLVSLGDLGSMRNLHELNARRNEIGDLARRGGSRGDLVDPRIFPEPRLPPNLKRMFLSHNKVAALAHVTPLRGLEQLEELSLDGCPIDSTPRYRSSVVAAVRVTVRTLDGKPVTADDRDGVDPGESIGGIDRGGIDRGGAVKSAIERSNRESNQTSPSSPGSIAMERARRALESRRAAAATTRGFTSGRTSVVNIRMDSDSSSEGDGSSSDPEEPATAEALAARIDAAAAESAATAAAEEGSGGTVSTEGGIGTAARPSSQGRPLGARELASSSGSRARRADFDEDARTLIYNGPTALPLDTFPYAPRAETLVFRDFTNSAQLRAATAVARRCCARVSNLRFKDCGLTSLEFVDDLAERAFPGVRSLTVEQGDGVRGSVLGSALLTPYVARRLPSVVSFNGVRVSDKDRLVGAATFGGIDSVLAKTFDALGGCGFPVRSGEGHHRVKRSNARGDGAMTEGVAVAMDRDGFNAVENAELDQFTKGVCAHGTAIVERLRAFESNWDGAVREEIDRLREEVEEEETRREKMGGL